MYNQAMKKFLFILAAVLQVAIAGAQQVDTTGFYSEKRDTLKAAAVTVRRDLVTADADKLTYNVQADPKAEGSNLIDILRAVPMLSINGEEEVLLNGSNDYKVLVNGRSTGMLARNFNQLIKTIPASSIKEIQVITNPPVKYDAEGIGGIINIVLARRLKSGYSGSIGTQGSNLGAASGNGYINAQLGKFTVSANASGTSFRNPIVYGVTDVENYTSEDYRYQRLDFNSNNSFSSGAFSLEASYEPDSLNLITLSSWANFQKMLSDDDITETFWNTGHLKTIEMNEPTVRTNRYKTFSGELAYQKTFRNDGGILTFSYAIDGNPNSTENDVIVVPILNYPDYHRHSFNTEHTIQQVGQIDYFAAYASYGYRFSKLTLKAGTRLEYTLNRGLSKSASGNLTFDNGNFNIVPYLNAAWKIDSRNTLSASYTRRLGRPSVTYLNPYIFEESPYSKMHGNPDLRTVVSDALTLTYRTSGETWDLTARTYGSLCNNKIEYLSEVYPDGGKVSTYENAVTYDHIDQMVSFNWNPGQRFSLQSSAKVGYNYFYAPSLDQKNDGVEWAFDLSSNVNLWKGAMGFFAGSISGGETTLQRTYHGVDYVYSLGLRQGFLQNRLILTARAIMPFQNRYNGSTRDTYAENYHQHNVYWYNPRQFYLGLTWRFGKTTINLRHAKKTQVSDKL